MTARGWIVLLAGCAVALAVGDVLLWRLGGTQATNSRHTLAIVTRYPIVAVLVGLGLGILGGHLFWGQWVGPGGVCP
jgi:hypothetical protein